jgi:hypothetical protein
MECGGSVFAFAIPLNGPRCMSAHDAFIRREHRCRSSAAFSGTPGITATSTTSTVEGELTQRGRINTFKERGSKRFQEAPIWFS